MYKAISNISIMITQRYKWSKSAVELVCHLRAGRKLFPQAVLPARPPNATLSCSGLLSSRHMCLCMSSWDRCLKSQSRVPDSNAVLWAFCMCCSLWLPHQNVCCGLPPPRYFWALCSAVATVCNPLYYLSVSSLIIQKHLLSKNYVPSTVLGTKWTKQIWYLIA